MLLDDPVFWDRVMLSQEYNSSPSAVAAPYPVPAGAEEGIVRGSDSPGTWVGEELEEHLKESTETIPAKKFKSAQQ